MTCIHGLDENNCPTCRIMAASLPKESLHLKNAHLNELKPEPPFLKINAEERKQFLNDLLPNNKIPRPIPINPIQEPNLITEKPHFQNRLFQERLKELDITKSDVFKISQKVKLENSQWKFDTSE
ncbi:MAG: hypothetical protein ACTSR8_00480 [Promethearchaeota archaeon]